MSGWRAIVAALALTLLVGTAGLALSRSPLFRLRNLQIAGVSHLTRGEVTRLAGLGPHTNVLWLDTEAVERQLEADPWIARALVRRRLPWTVTISVQERSPVAAIPIGSSFRVIAADGTVLDQVDSAPPLPQIVMPPPWVPGTRGQSPAGPARAIAALAPGVAARVTQAVLAPDGTLRLSLRNGPSIEYGPPTAVTAKAASIAAILRWARAQGVALARLDVSAPGAPAATPAS
ncbi:MAG TPA: FtsQ-type POTRA domain-containing protein [Actinomycetota bacterium]|nr:FtsQ-type POTRA domain-containing protein [Actinomycetota bacterium]